MTGSDGTAETQLALTPEVSPVDPGPHEPIDPTADRYESVELLGSGGMGDVNLCRDRRIGREVAVKQIRLGAHDNPEAKRRFLREAKVQAQLEHPAIVPVYDLGTDPDGHVFFTMKRVRGTSLRHAVDQLRAAEEPGASEPATEGWTRRKLYAVFLQVCLAVDYAHQRGVIHRDIKPENIMLGDFGEVYLLDWGLAKVAGDEDDDEVRIDPKAIELGPLRPGSGGSLAGAGLVSFDTAAGTGMLGTPGYMSPAQLEGKATPQNDIYALGAVLYELLTLQRMHQADGVLALVAKTIDAEIEHPSRRTALPVPPELERECLRAVEAEGFDPHQHVRAMHDAIEAFLEGDRDLELRRQAAAEAAARGEALATRAIESHDDTARAKAMRSVGRALGIEPGNRIALRTLARLLETPPQRLPESAARALADAEAQQVRVGTRNSAWGYLSWLVYVPLLFWMGVRDPLWIAAMSIMMVVASATHIFAASREGEAAKRMEWVALTVGTVALAATFRVFGLFVLFPTVLLGQVVGASLSPRRSTRLFAVALASAVLGLVALLEFSGVFAAQTQFDGSTMTVYPGLTDLPATLTPWVLLASSVALFATPVAIIGKMRDQLTRAQSQNELQTWHFRQLVSADDPDHESDRSSTGNA